MILKMAKNRHLLLIALFLLLLFGCNKDNDFRDKYARPTWLAGKLYTQILTKPEISTFAELLKVTGYDTIIDVSGTYTVFAPSNEAFAAYFQANAKYKSLASLPKAEALKLAKYHLVQNPWSKKQLQSLDIFGWIDTLDLTNNVPKGYKRETLVLGQNVKFGVAYSKYFRQNTRLKRSNLIDSTITNWHRRVFTDSRKFAPVFYKDYFSIYELTASSDYAFYFGRQFDNLKDIYYVNSKIIGDEIFAENGFVYIVDKVVEPLRNGMEILADKSKSNLYTSYYNLVNQFSELDYNEKETLRQAGADKGLKVDSLFNLRYPQLVFDINSERTKPPRGVFGLPGNVTIRYHHGIVAPTNEAFNSLINQYLAGGNNWGSLEASPENIKRIIANSSLAINPIYLTDLKKGFLNGESDIIFIDESSIVQKEYASNCTFIGVNKPIIPRAFSSVTGPVYTRKGFSKVMFAIEQAGLLPALKRRGANYSLYVQPDVNSAVDSSLIYDTVSEKFSLATLHPSIRKIGLTNEDLRLLLMNHVAIDQPTGIARKEFIKNLAGNHIIYDNITGEVRGNATTTYGYQGSKEDKVFPKKISTNSDNGNTYEINSWFSFSASDLFVVISSRFPKFHELIRKAGLSKDQLSKYTFISDNQNYTAFIPNDSVINATKTDHLTVKELQDFVMLHFVQGGLIFTDGKMADAFYETARIDENSTPFVKTNTKIRIIPGVDKISIPKINGNPALVLTESSKTNFITSRNLSLTGQEAFLNAVTNGVVHEIKDVIRIEEVERK